MQKVKEKVKFPNGYFVDSAGRAGGLALVWSDDVKVNILSASLHHIDCMVEGLFASVPGD